jgi:predicted CoA-binding protein
MQHGRSVIPVNPRKEAAHGQPGYANPPLPSLAICNILRRYASLLDIPQSQRVDVVDLFVASANAGAVADEAIKRGAKAVWFQLGVSDPQV